MVLDAVSNFVRGTADAAVGTDDTTVSVEDASIFPDPETDGEFNVVIWDVNNFPRPDQDGDVEIMRVTARDTTADELTVTRAQEMTSAASHPEGSAIHLSPTAKMFSDIESTFGDFWDAGAQELTGDVNNTNTTTTALEAETIANDRHYAGAFDAPDADERLDAALSFASAGDVIYLEAAEYSADRSINKIVNLVGTNLQSTNGTTITGEWTLEIVSINLMRFRGFDGEIVITTGGCQVTQSAGVNITDENGSSIISHIRQGDIILQSGTDRTVVDTCSETNVTDNGDNLIGDIS